MKKTVLFFILIGSISLGGCAKTTNENSDEQLAHSAISASQSTASSNRQMMTSSSESISHSSTTQVRSSSDTMPSSTTQSDTTEEQPLSKYTDDQIEYARIWLQLGANQEIDTLYIQKIPAGTPIVPSSSNSAVFPEDVIQLSGERNIDGSVTYGSNHDGTIDVYNVPTNLYWEFNTPAGTQGSEALNDEAQKVLETTKRVSVDVGTPSQVIRIIQLEKFTGTIGLSAVEK